MTTLEQYSKNPTQLIQLIEDVINQLKIEESSDEKKAKEEQLREISRAIENLEKKEVYIPQVLRAEKTRLIAEVQTMEEPTNALRELADGLHKLIFTLEPYLKNQPIISTQRKSRRKKNREPRTDNQTLRLLIIEALQYFGGSAPKREVHKYMEEKLKDKLLPGDLGWRESTRNYIWQNNTDWERFSMVQDGILKKGSPIGIWELSEEYK